MKATPVLLGSTAALLAALVAAQYMSNDEVVEAAQEGHGVASQAIRLPDTRTTEHLSPSSGGAPVRADSKAAVPLPRSKTSDPADPSLSGDRRFAFVARRQASASSIDDPFHVPPPPPPPKSAPPMAAPVPPPPPPAVPYRLLGRVVDDGEQTAIVGDRDRVSTVRRGETLGGFVFDSISESGVILKHTATDTVHLLMFGSPGAPLNIGANRPAARGELSAAGSVAVPVISDGGAVREPVDVVSPPPTEPAPSPASTEAVQESNG